MLIEVKVKGTAEVLKDLEEAKRLIYEAEKILYRIPMKLSLELSPDTGMELANESDQDNQ